MLPHLQHSTEKNQVEAPVTWQCTVTPLATSLTMPSIRRKRAKKTTERNAQSHNTTRPDHQHTHTYQRNCIEHTHTHIHEHAHTHLTNILTSHKPQPPDIITEEKREQRQRKQRKNQTKTKKATEQTQKQNCQKTRTKQKSNKANKPNETHRNKLSSSQVLQHLSRWPGVW